VALEVAPPLPVVLPLLVAPVTLPPLRRPRRRRRRSLTRTWDRHVLHTKYDPVNLSTITRIMRHEQEDLGGVERATSRRWSMTLRQYLAVCLLRYPE
jgi:hypothetical protein